MLCFGCRSIHADGTISKCRSEREGVATLEEQHSSMESSACRNTFSQPACDTDRMEDSLNVSCLKLWDFECSMISGDNLINETCIISFSDCLLVLWHA